MLTRCLCLRALGTRLTSTFVPDNDYRSTSLYRLGVFLTLIAMPTMAYEFWQQFLYIQDVGYLALYVEGVPKSTWATINFYIFYFGFGLALTFANSRTKFLLPALLYLILSTLDAFKGARGAVLVPTLFIAWYYSSRFDVRIRFWMLARYVSILVGVFALSTYQRDKSLVDVNVMQFIVDALSSQGRSLQLTALYLQVADQVGKYGNYMVLSNLMIPITVIIHPEIREAAQSFDQVLYSNNLKHILTYVLNESYYMSGGGVGGVYTIELIESGPMGDLILSMGLGWFLTWLPNAMRRSWVRYLSIYFFTTVFYMPRGEFFFNALNVGKAVFLYIFVIKVYDAWQRYFSIRSKQRSPASTTMLVDR